MTPKIPIETAPSSCSNCHLKRRDFLQIFVAGLGVAVLGGCGQDPSEGETKAMAKAAIAVGDEWKIPGAEKLKAGEALAFELPGSMPGLVFVSPQNQLVALSAKCTHAGCTVEWQSGKELHCPCHGSRFDLNGKVLSGPATAPLARFSARRQGGDVLVKSVSQPAK